MTSKRSISILLCLLELHSLNGFVIKLAPSIPKCSFGEIITSEWPLPEVDIVIEEKTNLDMYCTLNLDDPIAKNYTAKDIIFKRGDKKIDDKFVTVINETTSRLYLNNVTIGISKEYYFCALNAREDVKGSKEKIICMNSVLVGSLPKRLIGFSCNYYNWERFVCEWDQPNNGVNTDYSVVLVQDDIQEHRCPAIKNNQHHSATINRQLHADNGKGKKCTWITRSQPPEFRFSTNIHFRIHAINVFGEVIHGFAFKGGFKNVIPNPPNEIKILSKTPHSVYLQWNISQWIIYEHRLLDYKVLISARKKEYYEERRYSAADVQRYDDIVRVNVTDLEYPSSWYWMKIQMKWQRAGDDCWSSAVSCFVRTSREGPELEEENDEYVVEACN